MFAPSLLATVDQSWSQSHLFSLLARHPPHHMLVAQFLTWSYSFQHQYSVVPYECSPRLSSPRLLALQGRTAPMHLMSRDNEGLGAGPASPPSSVGLDCVTGALRSFPLYFMFLPYEVLTLLCEF